MSEPPEAEQSAWEQSHKQTAAEPEELPLIHPDQLTVFDVLGDG